MKNFNTVIDLIREERERQHKKWGVQKHSMFVWLAILMEEVGEASRAALHNTFGGDHAGTFTTEMIHVDAVAVQILEWLYEDETQSGNARTQNETSL